ncbi:hypothetical protein PPL_10794 [Heterostelium album PN500]|uniref:F-box domain-containing protein n=1 Tax=Heterostelium pallidum (strain ATCC 26659 / Pp 5 / PN500) TaxID=670386 RepID=D3BS04_HETP5|nr:hypothetical protein PPL_10794 [Heterostelium album PN500]EFA75741.1 hypothetical protein PPL_10794 [Heterostelium album PN500]|eukprot:XP_020427875.1 hypothetical protein PPL_10794 [Heterostelium album PN500]
MNNQTDKIVNLPHLILNKIITYLKDNIDIICFSLVCKRWYNDREKYLVFKTDHITLFALHNTDIKQCDKHFNLPSYHNVFMKSIQSKNDCILVLNKKLYQYRNYDYFYDDDLEYIYRLISESQSVTVLGDCHTLKYGLPKSIKSLKFDYDFDEPLVKGSLPGSLEVLDLIELIDQEIPPGVLPESLRELSIEHYAFEIQAGVLPSGLRKLTLSNSQCDIRPGILPSGLQNLYLGCHYEIQPGVLPGGLRKFSLFDYQHEIQAGVLPSSLESLSLISYQFQLKEDLQYSELTWEENTWVESKSYFPITWLRAISSLANLQSLFINFPKHNLQDITIFNVNYLPPTLESLDLRLYGKESILKGTMPTSLKNIYLAGCHFKFDELFPESLQYHLEIFDYEKDRILQIPSNIKIDSLSVTVGSQESSISLPSGIRSINLYMESSDLNEKGIDFGVDDSDTNRPSSLRELRLPKFIEATPKFKLPNTIEYLDIGKNNLKNVLHLIPSTLNTLVFRKLSRININIINSIKPITNIIYILNSHQTQTIRKLDDNYYLIYSENGSAPKAKLIAKIFHQSKLEQILRESTKETLRINLFDLEIQKLGQKLKKLNWQQYFENMIPFPRFPTVSYKTIPLLTNPENLNHGPQLIVHCIGHLKGFKIDLDRILAIQRLRWPSFGLAAIILPTKNDTTDIMNAATNNLTLEKLDTELGFSSTVGWLFFTLFSNTSIF